MPPASPPPPMPAAFRCPQLWLHREDGAGHRAGQGRKTAPGTGQGRAGKDGAGHRTGGKTDLKGLSMQLAEGLTKSLAVDGGPRVRGLTPLVSLNARGG